MAPPCATRVALLTPPGRGAISTVRVRGPAALAAVTGYFAPANGQPLAAEDTDRPRFGRWSGPRGEELITCVLDPQTVEIHCHGGLAAAAAITAALVAAGCETADWHTAEMLDERDPLRRAALRTLADVSTQRCAAMLLDQYAGALGRQIEAACRALSTNDAASATRLIAQLLDTARLGLHLVAPFRVALIGAPNVGKSSLINAILGFERSIVHEQPGTTRDALTATTAIDGWPIELIDTAGLHAATDRLEQSGIEVGRAQAAAADLVLLVIDHSRGASEADRQAHAARPDALVVANKWDLPAAAEANLAADCRTSAVSGQGVPELLRKVSARLVPSPPPPGAAVPFLPNQVHALERAASRLQSGDAAGAADCLARLLAD